MTTLQTKLLEERALDEDHPDHCIADLGAVAEVEEEHGGAVVSDLLQRRVAKVGTGVESQTSARGDQEGQQRRVGDGLGVSGHQFAENGVEEVRRSVSTEVVDEAGGVPRLLDQVLQSQLAEPHESIWIGHGARGRRL